MEFSTLKHHRVEIDSMIATVIIANPPVNAQNEATQEELILIMDCLSDDEAVRAALAGGGASPSRFAVLTSSVA